MIEETLPLVFDIERLQAHIREHVLPLPPVMAGKHFGGWSVLSSNGSYRDGWVGGHKIYEPEFMPGRSPEEKAEQLGLRPSSEYIKPTEVCTGYLNDVITLLRSLGLDPTRARLTILKAQGQSARHTDGDISTYCVRLHIPIVTNPACTFQTDTESSHLAASGHAYLIHVNRMHQVFNRGQTDRIHLIMDVRDRAHISQYHRWPLPQPR